jgi:hypothetical protein|tara:strand:- start:1043 stop:2770 length:1728 start_codon:yes stop_codon:yes gene_type:complete
MAWKKYFKDANLSPISGDNRPNFAKRNYSSYLPDVYTGHPNRIQRYFQYDQMDSDSEINAALDILAEFCSQKNQENETPFNIVFKDEVTSHEVKLLKKALQQWTKANQFTKRIFRIFRNALKYGDCFFVRDPETNKWLYIDNAKVDRIVVNESDGKKPEQYVIRDINPNLQRLSATSITPNQVYGGGGTTGGTYSNNYAGAGQGSNMSNASTAAAGGRFYRTMNQYSINAEHVVHLTMSDGLDNLFPFGQSVLEQVFKVYKQKELLEDAIIIYRVQRAPERRVFYIDVGNMPTHLAMQFVERVKNEINQRRIPSTSGGVNYVDATYNPMSINEDYFFPQTAEGRGSKVDTLPGGTNLGEIDDLRFFTNKLFRGLRIPSSYLPTGAEDGNQTYNDGRVGTAYIQELRFNKYCMRLQSMLSPTFDQEFKIWVKEKGYNLDNGMFEIKFNPPQNFAAYRQTEMDQARVNTFTAVAELPYMSKRFALSRYLGLSEEEMARNADLWAEENAVSQKSQTKSTQLRTGGVSQAGISSDLDQFDEPEAPEGAPPPEGTTPGTGGTGGGTPGGTPPTPGGTNTL